MLLNNSKTEVIVFNPFNGSTSSAFDSPALPINPNQTILNLGVKIESALQMDAHINQMAFLAPQNSQKSFHCTSDFLYVFQSFLKTYFYTLALTP